MKITFSILWFDDASEYFESLDLDSLKEAISSWGFSPVVKLVTTPDEFMAHEPFHEFDLIVVDYNLEEYDKHGQEFIKKIRDHGIYTEVIFYSANRVSDLWDAVREKELEGVFVSGRTGVLTKIENVAEQSVRKILDLENVRGIVMAEVGNIDLKLESILHVAIGGLSEVEQDKIFTKYIERIVGQAESNIEKVKGIGERSLEGLLMHCDSNKRWSLFRSVSKKHPSIDLGEFGDYAEEVLGPRNYLAHGRPEKQGDGSFLFKHNGNDYAFDEVVSADLRNKLQMYYGKFERILTSLAP